MNKQTRGIIIGLVIGLVLGAIAGYVLHNNINKNFLQGRGNFQIDENTKNEINSFFKSTSDRNEINFYCEQNRINCAYYCRSINPNNDICKEIMNSSQIGGRPWNP